MSVSERQYQGILGVIECLCSSLDSREIRELAGGELLKLLRADYFASFTWCSDERRFGVYRTHVFSQRDGRVAFALMGEPRSYGLSVTYNY